MWLEVLPNNDKLLQKFCDAQNNISCGVYIETFKPDILKQQLEQIKDCHAFYYDGKDIKCILQYKWSNYNKKVQIIKLTITWDIHNKEIDPFDGVGIVVKHIYNYIKTRGGKAYFHTEPKYFPPAMLVWCKENEIIRVCKEEGIKLEIKVDDRFSWWNFELI